MKKDVFDYDDYTSFLKDWIEGGPKKGHGMRKKIAKHLECPAAHISQVLKGDTNLTLEQAAKLVIFLELPDLESNYFLHLIELKRASSEELKRVIRKRLQKTLDEKNQNIKNFDLNIDSFSDVEKEMYYSSWHFIATKVLLSIDKYQTPKALSERLGLSLEKIIEVITFFLENGLIKKSGKKYITNLKSKKMSAGQGTLIQKIHNKNWRTRALLSIDFPEKDNLHLTHIFSISKKDIPKLKIFLIKSLENFIAQVRSTDVKEEAMALCLDYFKL